VFAPADRIFGRLLVAELHAFLCFWHCFVSFLFCLLLLLLLLVDRDRVNKFNGKLGRLGQLYLSISLIYLVAHFDIYLSLFMPGNQEPDFVSFDYSEATR
jgi:hypothetical protein